MHKDVIGDRSNADILGENVKSVKELVTFVERTVWIVSDLNEIACKYISVGKKYGIRGDIAFCQAILETNYFRFGNGSAVTKDQHNYCGMGVTSKGVKGNTFKTIGEGVTAHIQHLYAYACKLDLPKNEILIDPRFKYVKRGCSPTWYMLGGKWSTSKEYGYKILSIYEKV